MSATRIAHLISSSAGTIKNSLAATPDTGEIVLVISDVEDAPGLADARDLGIPVRTIKREDFASPRTFEAEIDEALREAGVDLVLEWKFLREAGSWFLDRWKDRILSIVFSEASRP